MEEIEPCQVDLRPLLQHDVAGIVVYSHLCVARPLAWRLARDCMCRVAKRALSASVHQQGLILFPPILSPSRLRPRRRSFPLPLPHFPTTPFTQAPNPLLHPPHSLHATTQYIVYGNIYGADFWPEGLHDIGTRIRG